MKEENPFLRAALAYAARLGWPVFPLKPRAKEPLTAHGHKDATLDETIIRQWWKKWPKANIGIPTGVAFWALDVDPRHGGDDSLMALVARHTALADTIQQMTGGGGSQLLWQNPPGAKMPCHNGVWPGIDVKGEGGYIVVPPSIHPSGKEYVWDTAKKSILEERINPANPWLVVEIMAAANHHTGPTEPFELPERIPKGKRHPTLFRMGCAMRHKGCGHPEILAALWEINQQRCEEPYARDHIETLAADIAQRYRAGPGDQEPAPEEKREAVLPSPLTVAEVLDLDIPLPETLIENLLPRRGLALMIGAQRSGKTAFAAQVAIALATRRPLFDYYSLKAPGAVIVMEKDDPGGNATFKDIYLRAQVPRSAPIHYYGPDRIPIPLGEGFKEWLEIIVPRTQAVLVVLDSYTALRPAHKTGGDIVLEERRDITELDALAKRLSCLILLLHHESITTRSNSALDWDARGAGTFGLTMATECQIAITRYRELGIDAPERLLRLRSRHLKEHQLTLRYDPASGLFEHVIDGAAAPLYHLIHEIKRHIRTEEFTAKDLEEPLGIARPTVFRHLAALVSADALWRSKGGTYRFAPDVERLKISGRASYQYE